MMVCLFACLWLKRPSQQLWLCRDVASILWDCYLILGRHDTINVLENVQDIVQFLCFLPEQKQTLKRFGIWP